MLTLLSSIVGFLSSAIPDLLELVRDRSDRRHELAIMDRQLAAQKHGHTERLDEIRVMGDIAETKALYSHASTPAGVTWVDAMRAAVRPVITYCFFGLFSVVKIAGLWQLVSQGEAVTEAFLAIWDSETQALFAAVMSFWFGQRALTKFKGEK
jgi:hypothetical protein